MSVFKVGIMYCERYVTEADTRHPVGMNKYVLCFDFISQETRRYSILNMRGKGSVIRVSFRHLFDYIKPVSFYTRFHISSTRFETE